MDYNEIIDLMKEMNNAGLTKIKLEQGDFKLVLEKNNIIGNEAHAMSTLNTVQTAPINMTTDQLPVSEQITNNDQQYDAISLYTKTSPKKELPGTKKILSPMVGTFYGQPAPDKPPFAKIGDLVKKGQTVCIIEAMKLMNEIESEVEGEIIECLVENEDMVEFGQPLYIVK